jgi:hypothetical protein
MTRLLAKLLIGLLDASTFYVLRSDGNPPPESSSFGDVGPQRDDHIGRNAKVLS